MISSVYVYIRKQVYESDKDKFYYFLEQKKKGKNFFGEVMNSSVSNQYPLMSEQLIVFRFYLYIDTDRKR